MSALRSAVEIAMAKASNIRVLDEVLDRAEEVAAGYTRLVNNKSILERLAEKGYVTSDMGRSHLAAALNVNPEAVEAEIIRRRRGGNLPSTPRSNRSVSGRPLPPSPETNTPSVPVSYAPYIATALGGGLMGAGLVSYLNNTRHGRTNAELYSQYPYGVY